MLLYLRMSKINSKSGTDEFIVAYKTFCASTVDVFVPGTRVVLHEHLVKNMLQVHTAQVKLSFIYLCDVRNFVFSNYTVITAHCHSLHKIQFSLDFIYQLLCSCHLFDAWGTCT